MIKFGILGSTRGTSMQKILEARAEQTLSAHLALVVSNRKDALILEKARAHEIPAFFIDSKGLTREQYDERISLQFQEYGVDFILLIGYMRILSVPFIATWKHRILNVHPSLLPAFAKKMDLAVHEAVLQSGVSETGCTVHEVTEIVDGGPIVVQKKCPVLAEDTPEILKARVQQLEAESLVDAIHLLSKRDPIHACCHH